MTILEQFKPWMDLATVVAAGVAAIAAAIAARATRKAAEAAVLHGFLRDYAAPEMLDALRVLRRWREQEGEAFATTWESRLRTGDRQAMDVDRARRHVGSYFENADRMHQAELISEKTLKAAVDKSGLAVLFKVIEELEPRLYPKVDLKFIGRLRKLCPSRVSEELIAAVPLVGQERGQQEQKQ